MAPKRKSDAAETSTDGPRRSTRTTNASDAPAVSKPASKGKPASAGKKTAAESKDKKQKSDDKEDAPDAKEEPAAKKAKTGSAVVSVGEQVGDVTLKNEDDEETSLASLYDKSGLVIFSYPKANTPGCTTQACGFRDIHEEIAKLNYAVIGLSADPPKSQKSWKTKNTFQYHLLSDPKKELLKKLGATDAQKRCHWVIEKGGKLLEAKIGVKPADDPKNTLEFLKGL